MTKRILMLLLCCAALSGCSEGEESESVLEPAMSLEIASFGSTSVTLEVKRINASHVRILCEATRDATSYTGRDVFEKGRQYTETTIRIDGLTPMTTYTVFAVACNDAGDCSALQIARFSTDGSESDMYPWEQDRGGILSFTDMVLCYGGSTHRTPYRWEKERFAPFVTYTDKQGREHWLFDSFLCIEFQTISHSFMVGLKLPSAEKTQWQGLIDYWFGSKNGVNALESAVADAAQRLGTPPSKRKVIMVLPDPIIYREFADTKTPTNYWGMLNGRQMDFAQSKDRIAVYKWYINEVRRRFHEAAYRYIELAGFYIVSEDLATPSFGWNPELKKSHEVIPPISEYLHGINECVCWIPYNRAMGYNHWKEMGIDYAYMQPNHFWDDKNERPLSRFFSDIAAQDLAMEFEFDDELLEGKKECDDHKARFRNYMSGARQNGVYGRKPLSYYHGTNGFYNLWASKAAKDQELFHEFCQFVIDNPLRKND